MPPTDEMGAPVNEDGESVAPGSPTVTVS
jgi:hypothetical protein